MRRQEISDFLVETNGRCFICSRECKPDQLSPCSTTLSSQSQSHSSLHALSQYLKVDISQVFHEKESIPSELLDNVKRSRLKVSLCEQCTKWNEKVAGLCRQLEKIETEVSFYLELIHGSLLSLDNNGRTDVFRYTLNDGDDANSKGKLLEKERIVKALRTETRQKCSQRLNKSAQPIVKVQNLTAAQVTSKQERISSKSTRKYVKPKMGDGSGNWLDGDDINQIKNECCDVHDGEEYFDDDAQFVEDPINEDESSDDPHQFTTCQSSHQSHLYHQTEPSTVNSNVKRASMSRAKSSSVKILSSPSSESKRETLTYVINPDTGKFKCNFCSVECTEKGSLKRHYGSIHLKTRHKCTLCGKEFTSKTDCTRHHKTVHVGVRFKCNLCDKCFTQRCALIDHHKTVHLGKRFQCNLCEKSFAQKSNLTAHIKSSHAP